MGEDIVLTYQLLRQKLPSTYEPGAVGYTTVPETFNGLYNQRKRWQSVCWRDYPLFRLGNRGRDMPAILLS